MRRSLITFIVLLFSSSIALAANTVTLNADLVSGSGSVAPTLTWSTSPTADSCVASGAWTGNRAASGSQLQTTLTKSATYVLVCTWGNGQAVVNWTPPTTNTDGSALTDLAGFKLYKQVGTGPFSLLTTINSPSTLTFTDTPLAPGTYGYQGTAFNSGGIESAHTGTVTKTIIAANVTQSIAITVNPMPDTMGNFAVN